MKKGSIVGIVILVLIVLVALSTIGTYNDLVSKREDIEGKLSDISVQLERRADLIPNLVNTVKGYMEHEESIIESVTKARENLVNAKTVEEKANANQELTTSINNLIAIVENYPDLKANENFINLQDELAGTENRIAVARKDYNDTVKNYNKAIKSFPKNMLASMCGFDEAEYFEAKESSNEVPNVSFKED